MVGARAALVARRGVALFVGAFAAGRFAGRAGGGAGALDGARFAGAFAAPLLGGALVGFGRGATLARLRFGSGRAVVLATTLRAVGVAGFCFAERFGATEGAGRLGARVGACFGVGLRDGFGSTLRAGARAGVDAFLAERFGSSFAAPFRAGDFVDVGADARDDEPRTSAGFLPERLGSALREGVAARAGVFLVERVGSSFVVPLRAEAFVGFATCARDDERRTAAGFLAERLGVTLREGADCFEAFAGAGIDAGLGAGFGRSEGAFVGTDRARFALESRLAADVEARLGAIFSVAPLEGPRDDEGFAGFLAPFFPLSREPFLCAMDPR